jgi:hypothetical protein
MTTASNFASAARAPDEIKINSGLWADGAGRRRRKKALETVASDYGNFLALATIADAHRRAAVEATSDPRAAIERLRTAITSQPIEPGDRLPSPWPACRCAFRMLLDDSNVRSLVRIRHAIGEKPSALKELAAFEETAPTMRAADVAGALSQAADRYAAWHSRLAR